LLIHFAKLTNNGTFARIWVNFFVNIFIRTGKSYVDVSISQDNAGIAHNGTAIKFSERYLPKQPASHLSR
jgi:hypothetical protein